ncbi:MAG: hypothetical protein DWQ05_16840 [Calditrichaeota bacterium]|nr:MAG: hypothetical protein DWQ05_16840 [Calditrichota bacterium]
MDVFNVFAGMASIIGTGFALGAWLKAREIDKKMKAKEERLNRKITVALQVGGKTYDLPFKFRRAEFTRAEILGRIGMIPTKNPKQRFELTYTNTSKFLERVNQINDEGGESIFVIPCSDEEFDQFNFDANKVF